MNKKSGFVLRMVAGLYLSYLGIALFSQAMRDKPSDYMMKAVIAVIFLGVGVWYTIRNIRALYQLTMGDSGDKHKKDASGETGSKRNLQNHSTIRQSFGLRRCRCSGRTQGKVWRKQICTQRI